MNYSHFAHYHDHMKETMSGRSRKHGFSEWVWVSGDGESLLPWIFSNCEELEGSKFISMLSLVPTVLPWTRVSATTSTPGQEWWEQLGKVLSAGKQDSHATCRKSTSWRAPTGFLSGGDTDVKSHYYHLWTDPPALLFFQILISTNAMFDS